MNARIILVIAIATLACNNETASVETSSDEVMTTSLGSSQQQLAQVKLGVMQRRSMSNTVEARGHLDAPPQHLATITPMVAGFIKSTKLLEGDEVRKGQVIVTLTHPDYVNMQQRFLEGTRQLDYLRSEYERQVALDKDRINAKKSLLKADADYQAAQARIEGLRQQLLMLGINPKAVMNGTITSEVQLTSPIAGYVTMMNSTIGQLVSPGELVSKIVNLEHLHVEMNVFEEDLPKLKIGQPFSFTTSGSDTEHSGSLYLIGKSFGEERTVHVHGHPDEVEDYFLPGMYVSATISTDTDSTWSLPEQAVVNSNQEAYVFLKESEGNFTKLPVQTGREFQGWIEIMPDGSFSPEDSVAIEGAYYLSAASEMGE